MIVAIAIGSPPRAFSRRLTPAISSRPTAALSDAVERSDLWPCSARLRSEPVGLLASTHVPRRCWQWLGAVELYPPWPTSRYLTRIPCFWAISFNCSRVSCFGGAPGALATSRKNASSPGGATTQSSNSSLSGFSTPCQTPLGI